MNKSLDFRRNLKSFLIDNLENLIDANFTFIKYLFFIIKESTKLQDFIKERIEAERCYINYDDDDFVLLKPYIITEKDPDDKVLEYLYTHFGIDQKLF